MAFDVNRILIADDDERPRQLLAHYLKNWGFTVTECRDGLEAAGLLESASAPSLAIIDWMMPGLEGVEICRRIRRLSGPRPYTYIILVTGNSDAAAGLQAGADDFVNKPYNVDELRARIAVGQRVLSLERRLAEHISLLRDALEQVGKLPGGGAAVCVCPRCKSTRDEKDRWYSIEDYLEQQLGTEPIPELCPDCEQSAREAAEQAHPLRHASRAPDPLPTTDS